MNIYDIFKFFSLLKTSKLSILTLQGLREIVQLYIGPFCMNEMYKFEV